MATTLKHVALVVMDLRAERAGVAARLDAIDLALANLARVYNENGATQTPSTTRARKASPRRAVTARRGVEAEVTERDSLLLKAIRESAHGRTAGELRRATPNMLNKDRANRLQILKRAGAITRSGNAWIAARS